jgi:hypothetical protein
MTMAEVLAHKTCTAKFTVPDGTRLEIEKAIAERLRSGQEVVWEDDPVGVNVDVLSGNNIWRPRKRF